MKDLETSKEIESQFYSMPYSGNHITINENVDGLGNALAVYRQDGFDWLFEFDSTWDNVQFVGRRRRKD